MRLLEAKESNAEFQTELMLFREHFDSMYSKQFKSIKTYDVIDNMRNSLLHGETYWQKLYGVLINLICILVN